MYTGNIDSFVKGVGINKDNDMTLSNPEKQQKVENIFYLKTHLDLVVVSLAIIYLVYQIRQVSKNAK